MEVIANLSLVNYTQKGIENVKESPQRLEAAKQAFQGMGAELKELDPLLQLNWRRTYDFN
ncbi:MAG TPA: hypothetical protein VMW10_07995 [Alphaproteobacteria bacterium]|nr:hypothetical protein [Alphaproteobacteria bacterium]